MREPTGGAGPAGPTWRGAEPPEIALGWADYLRATVRGLLIVLLLLCGIVVKLLVLLVERLFRGGRRVWSPAVTQIVCRLVFVILGMRHAARGARMSGPGAYVANHSSWLDIFTLNARRNVLFVSKAEVAGWPGIGLLAKLTGTVFINRDRREARAQPKVIEARLLAGDRLLFFPEGTSTDGLRVLPFKTTLFEAFLSDGLRVHMQVQPVTVSYHAPRGADPAFYGWWGDMALGPHLLRVLGARRQGYVEVVYHDPLRVAEFANRKALARAAEARLRSAHPSEGVA
ncbi:lysophospholipid acyltransferase family protein [Alloyangia pacifica]|uniref:Lyso-ornithine lipid acyltransferase n=1 Tax=Alloyangia pacifica TaxID=311180 RepID=A0A1I6P0V3_9RHOB|nr:lysophospholipid acyltransferase family protein [Alloyangia pacifica]SDH54687.1 lyso-ornithine lipid acyltransferase [Alloyangia pacifica]SFS33803.1 lyso-ornithine lipid acyltransferase [Alloyangia pacifica]